MPPPHRMAAATAWGATLRRARVTLDALGERRWSVAGVAVASRFAVVALCLLLHVLVPDHHAHGAPRET